MDTLEVKKLSRTAVEEYRQRLDELKNITRLEIAQQIKEARAFGDITENAEYDAAMDHQARVEYEIAQLEELLANVEIIDETAIDLSNASVGARVKLRFMSDDSIAEYDIVSTSESEPFARDIRIQCDESEFNERRGYSGIMDIKLPARLSNESPVGQALIGHSTGDVVEAYAPGGLVTFEILHIGRVPDLPRGKTLSDTESL